MRDYYIEEMKETYSKDTADEYISLLSGALERLSPDIVIHRLTGDGPRNLLIAPLWSTDKKNILNRLHAHMESTGAYQGRRYTAPSGFTTI